MKNFISVLFTFMIIFSFTSCEKSLVESQNSDVQARKIILCDNIDWDISTEWNDDCSDATIHLSICCSCLRPVGSYPPIVCRVPAGTINLQAETCPFEFEYFNQSIPSLSINAGSCYEIEFNLSNPGCEHISVSQLTLDGLDISFEEDSSNVNCN